MKMLLVLGLAGLAPIACSSSNGSTAGDGGVPSIAITSPASGVSVSTTTSTDVPVVFTVTNFALMAAGTCGAVNDNCGHVHLLVDGTACNAGAAYNSSFPLTGAASSPATATAQLSKCPTATGNHTLKLELHRDDHSAVSNGASATVDIVGT